MVSNFACTSDSSVLKTEAADFSNPKANWTGHISRRNCFLNHVIEGKLQGRIGMSGR